MESLTELNRKIDERVNEIIIEKLLEAGYHQHIKHGFKSSCDCNFCELKRDKRQFVRDREILNELSN